MAKATTIFEKLITGLTVALISTVFLAGTVATARGVSADFVLRTAIDSSWTLRLFKNKTYSYTLFSGITGNSSILDSGTYSKVNDKIIFNSMSGDKSFDNKVYYIKKCFLLKGQCFILTDGQFASILKRHLTFPFKHKVYLFSYYAIDSVKIIIDNYSKAQ